MPMTFEEFWRLVEASWRQNNAGWLEIDLDNNTVTLHTEGSAPNPIDTAELLEKLGYPPLATGRREWSFTVEDGER